MIQINTFALLVAVVTFAVLFNTFQLATNEFWTEELYCEINAPERYYLCTRLVSTAGFSIVLIPIAISALMYAIVVRIQKGKKKELLNETL